MIKTLEISVGVLLLTNQFAPFAIVLIAPNLFGITTIHLFLNPAGLPLMIFLHALHGVIAYGYKNYYRSVFTRKADD